MLAEPPGPWGKNVPGAPLRVRLGASRFHLAGAREALASPGSQAALSQIPRPQEALKRSQATSLCLAATTSAHCCGLGPWAPTCQASACPRHPRPSPVHSSLRVPPTVFPALRRAVLYPFTKPRWGLPHSPRGALLPSGFKSAPFCRSGPGSKPPPPPREGVCGRLREQGSSTVLGKSDTTAEKACLSPC